MKDEINRVKQANPYIDHKEAFKQAAANWRFSVENPKITPGQRDEREDEDDEPTTVPGVPSPYNKFMKAEISRVKQANPDIDHKEAFKQAAAKWKVSPENPKN